ncbi:MAG: hydrogenase iron-sulfur subunit [Deltaproteobacteria bacterium]|nr:hydrogenase iron-sulfur subunit [Deltaproteobacteria bacterium]
MLDKVPCDDASAPDGAAPSSATETASPPPGEPKLPPLPGPVVKHTSAMPPVRGQVLLKPVDRGLTWLADLVRRAVPDEVNPVIQTGAVANISLLIACATGVLLLIWYSSSVHQAHESLEAMRQAPLTAQLVRSLHRYSSDACMLFVVLHASQYFFARRFTGARWLAWITGLFLIGSLWFVGWLGYWLVWDERGKQVALASAKLLDVLPIFADPLGRSFLTDSSVNSLLFFMVFFFHMLLPLGMGIALWLHITRCSRPNFLGTWKLAAWVLGSLVVLSLVLPAFSVGPAKMLAPPTKHGIDWWYLMPIAFADRLSGGMLWALTLLVSLVLYGAPWWMRKARVRPAVVSEEACTSCEKCYNDCPYGAISMVPRSDGRNYPSRAQVDPSRCVGCGICAGSCDSAGIGLPWLPVWDQRRRIESWVEEQTAGEKKPYLALVCAESAGQGLSVEPESGACSELPGYRVLPIPCSGWVHPLSIERALKRGAEGVLVVGCSPGGCRYREGGAWTELRLAGQREPVLRHDKVDAARVRFLRLDSPERGRLVEEARAFREGRLSSQRRSVSRMRSVPAGAAIAAALGAVTFLPSDLAYSTPPRTSAELLVSVKHPGRAGDQCRKVSPEELAKLPPHMRRPTICERGRASVRVRVSVDGRVLLERPFAPRGIFGDGNSIAIERFPVASGKHRVVVELGETRDPKEWSFRSEKEVTFEGLVRRVVLYDRLAGFTWH